MRIEDYGATPVLREPPHSLEAEQSVLGGLMLDNGAWPAVERLAGCHFFDHTHRTIYQAIGEMVASRQPVDIITVHARLCDLGKADECGGLPYLNRLCASVPSAANVRRYAEIVIEQAALRDHIAAADEMASAAFSPGARSALELTEAAQRRIQQIAIDVGPRTAPFKLVDLELLGEIESTAQQFFWQSYIPSGYVALLNGHGGSLKTTLALALGCCMSVGAPYLGRATRRARVAFFSGEDPAERILRLVVRICRTLELDPRLVREQLVIVDATEFDPVLFFERRSGVDRAGTTTATYSALERLIEDRGIEMLIVDNASDVFEGDEIKRSSVRAFMRSLVALVRPRGGAVLLLAHVDKVTSRNGKAQQGTETYSGSTAWHNTSRSRLYLSEVETGRFELQHLKCNVGPRQDTMSLALVDGALQLPSIAGGEPGGATAQVAVDANDTRALIRLIAEFTQRQEFVAPAQQSRHHAAKLFAQEPTYPKRKPDEVFGLLREAERRRYIERVEYATDQRKKQQRWGVTSAGLAFAGLSAPSAPSAPCG